MRLRRDQGQVLRCVPYNVVTVFLFLSSAAFVSNRPTESCGSATRILCIQSVAARCEIPHVVRGQKRVPAVGRCYMLYRSARAARRCNFFFFRGNTRQPRPTGAPTPRAEVFPRATPLKQRHVGHSRPRSVRRQYRRASSNGASSRSGRGRPNTDGDESRHKQNEKGVEVVRWRWWCSFASRFAEGGGGSGRNWLAPYTTIAPRRTGRGNEKKMAHVAIS